MVEKGLGFRVLMRVFIFKVFFKYYILKYYKNEFFMLFYIKELNVVGRFRNYLNCCMLCMYIFG